MGKRVIRILLFMILLSGVIFQYALVPNGVAGRSDAGPRSGNGINETGNHPIVIITADKLDSLELLQSGLPSVQQLLAEGACGLMNIRSSAGYGDSASGYLTLGTGTRSKMPGESGRTFEIGRPLPGGNSDSYLYWSLGKTVQTLEKTNLLVPEIGWIKNQAFAESRQVDPGRLGAIFHANGWRTCLIGNLDTFNTRNRPGGLVLMDRQGIIDEGNIGDSINQDDFGFPYRYRFSVDRTINELRGSLTGAKLLIGVEFGDFYRLNLFRDEMTPTQYLKLKETCWQNFDRFLAELFKLRRVNPFVLVVVSPSVSKESLANKNLLTPVMIYGSTYQPGLLTSGTTKWPGLVANIDLLPTLLQIANIQTKYRLIGRVATVNHMADYREKLRALNLRLIANNKSQRPILDWFMGLTIFCWITGLLLFCLGYFKKNRWQNRKILKIAQWLITFVAVIPLTLIVLPLFPAWFWQVGSFLFLTAVLSILFIQVKDVNTRILILSGLIWGVLILDQILGWRLIRFSPLGYSAMAGSRYYGLGNEFMGVFLAAALIFGHLVNEKQKFRWLPPFILGLSIFVLSWPQLGAKFGGILSGTAGFSYYLIRFYKVNFRDKKLWFFLLAGVLGLAAIGWWDSLRPPEVQTHIGRFIRLFFVRDFQQVGEIIFRKLAMNLRLTVVSPWIRIILATLSLGVIIRLVTKEKLGRAGDEALWKSILITGIAAYLVNDAGVLAFATCLVYGFSFMLLKMDFTRFAS